MMSADRLGMQVSVRSLPPESVHNGAHALIARDAPRLTSALTKSNAAAFAQHSIRCAQTRLGVQMGAQHVSSIEMGECRLLDPCKALSETRSGAYAALRGAEPPGVVRKSRSRLPIPAESTVRKRPWKPSSLAAFTVAADASRSFSTYSCRNWTCMQLHNTYQHSQTHQHSCTSDVNDAHSCRDWAWQHVSTQPRITGTLPLGTCTRISTAARRCARPEF